MYATPLEATKTINVKGIMNNKIVNVELIQLI